MEIRTREELKYIMQFHNIPFVEIVDGSHDMGKVTQEMKYEPGSWRYNRGYEYLAFVRACEQLSEDYDEIVKWKETSRNIFTTRLLYGTWSGEKTPVKNYIWSDAEECHISTSKDADGYLLLQGRINDLKNFLSYANDHMRYCRERYYCESEDVKNYIKLFDRYGLRNSGDDGYKWWHVGIVD